jgi:hypothetical protein
MTFLPALRCEYRSEADILDDPPDTDLHRQSAPESNLNKRSLQPNVNQITLRHFFRERAADAAAAALGGDGRDRREYRSDPCPCGAEESRTTI